MAAVNSIELPMAKIDHSATILDMVTTALVNIRKQYEGDLTAQPILPGSSSVYDKDQFKANMAEHGECKGRAVTIFMLDLKYMLDDSTSIFDVEKLATNCSMRVAS